MTVTPSQPLAENADLSEALAAFDGLRTNLLTVQRIAAHNLDTYRRAIAAAAKEMGEIADLHPADWADRLRDIANELAEYRANAEAWEALFLKATAPIAP